VLGDHAASDAHRARAVLIARFGEGPYDLATRRRAASFLARRGFDEDAVSSVVGLDDGLL
jgi:SOS response regulatory protein OraA/RecX